MQKPQKIIKFIKITLYEKVACCIMLDYQLNYHQHKDLCAIFTVIKYIEHIILTYLLTSEDNILFSQCIMFLSNIKICDEDKSQ